MSIVLVFGLFIPFSNGAEEKIYPTVIVAGYSSSNLYLETENGPQKIWGVNVDNIIAEVLQNIAQIGRGLGELAFGHPEYISDVVGKAIVELYGMMAYNPNGTSVNDIHPYSYDAAKTQFSYLYNVLGGENIHEPKLMGPIADVYAEKYGVNGNDYIFSYQTDFRQSIIDSAADLDRYIDSVREFTNSDKVNIIAVSHGGEVSSVYLNLYGTQKNAVHNAVLTVPAIGGAALAYDVMSESVVLDEETLLYFIENGNMIEADINWLFRANQFGILDTVCNLLIHNYIKQILGYWGSMWDFIPGPYYDELKTKYLNETDNNELIRKSDIYHYEILPTMTQRLNECVAAGMNIDIVAGTDIPSVTGLQESSDAIITVNSSTGAYTAPYGTRFNDGYVQKNTVCTDPSHNHLSPAMTIDASCGYLPETTWYVNGLFHGMTSRDPYALGLSCMLLFTEDHIDVHTDPAYPQFKFAENCSYSVTARFNNSAEGYVCAEDNALIVKNLSNKYKMKLVSVTCQGADLTFNVPAFTYLDPLETVSVSYNGTLPATSLTTLDLTLTYMLIGNVPAGGSKTYTYTIINGEPAVYNEAEPFTQAQYPTQMESRLSDTSVALIKKSGLFDWFALMFNMLVSMFRMFSF